MHNSLIYTFPKITKLSDVLPHIQTQGDREFGKVFSVINKGWYTVVNYNFNSEEVFKWYEDDVFGSIIRRECRGLIFDADGYLISRPYHKFFNVGEKEELSVDNVNLNTPHVIYDKLDGSMIRPIPVNYATGEFRLGTKAGITDTSMNAETWLATKTNYQNFIRDMMKYGLTPIFEWCSRKNRIVVDYPIDRLVLTAIRDTQDGHYLGEHGISALASMHNIECVKTYQCNGSLSEMVEMVRQWDSKYEGVVIRYDNGHMLKIKSEDYLQLHRVKSMISDEKNVIKLILNDAIDDLIPLLPPEDVKRLQSFQRAFWFSVDETASEIVDIYLTDGVDIEDQKEFAQQFVSTLPRKMRQFMYGIRQGKSAKQMIVDAIRKSTTSQKKVNEARWMWGNLDWNHHD